MANNKCYYGSGRVYTFDYDASSFPTIADAANITKAEKDALAAFAAANMTTANQIGYLKDGYQFSISTNKLTDKSDLGEIKIDVITEETATVNISLFNANAETIAKQYPTARHTSVDGWGITAVGGLVNLDETPKVIIFKHDDNNYGDSLVVCVGKNTSGFDAVWKQDAVTPFPCTFEVQPFNANGILALFCDAPKDYSWDNNSGT